MTSNKINKTTGGKTQKSSEERDTDYTEDVQPKTKKAKTTQLKKNWPEIQVLAENGVQPQAIAKCVNMHLLPQDQLDNKQISDLLTRKKKMGLVKLPVKKASDD